MSVRDDVEREELIDRAVETLKGRLNGDNVTRPQEEMYRGILDHLLDMEARIEDGQILSMLSPAMRKKVAAVVGTAVAVLGSLLGTGVIGG